MPKTGDSIIIVALALTGIILISPVIQTSFCLESSMITSNNSTIGEEINSDIRLYSDQDCKTPVSDSYFSNGVVSCYGSSGSYTVSNTMTSLLGVKNAYIKVNTQNQFSLTIKSNYTSSSQTNSILNKVTMTLTPIGGEGITKSTTNWQTAMSGFTFTKLDPDTIYSIDILVGYNGTKTISTLEKIYLDISFIVNDGKFSTVNKNNEIQFSASKDSVGGIEFTDGSGTHDMDLTDNVPGITIPSGCEAVIIKKSGSESGSFCDKNTPATVQIKSDGNNPFFIYLYGPKQNGNNPTEYFTLTITQTGKDPVTINGITGSGYIGYATTTTIIDGVKTVVKTLTFSQNYSSLSPLDEEYTITINGKPQAASENKGISVYILFSPKDGA